MHAELAAGVGAGGNGAAKLMDRQEGLDDLSPLPSGERVRVRGGSRVTLAPHPTLSPEGRGDNAARRFFCLGFRVHYQHVSSPQYEIREHALPCRGLFVADVVALEND